MLQGHMQTAHEINQSRQQIAACWNSHIAAAASSPVRHAAKPAAVEIARYNSLKIVKNANCQHITDQTFEITQHTLIYTLYIILFQNKNISCQVPFKHGTYCCLQAHIADRCTDVTLMVRPVIRTIRHTQTSPISIDI